tara:strand:+ start:331 stop:918 length:588 start_codon:yes stop_codon:yes gene_type:complete
VRLLIIILLLTSTQVSAKNIFKELNNDEILLTTGKNYQIATKIGSSSFKSNFQNTFGIKIPINNTNLLGCNIEFYSLIPNNSTSNREYKVRAITPTYTTQFKKTQRSQYFYGIKTPIQIILYKESGTIDTGDEQLTAFGLESFIGSSITIYKTLSLQLEFGTLISYLPKLIHQSNTTPEKNKLYYLPKFSLSIIF